MTIAPLLFALLAAPAAARADAPVILDFTASWCGPCQQMRPAVAKLIKSGYPVKAVDFDSSPDLVKRYKITGVPTFVVVDADGRELDRISGYRPAQDIASLYNKSRGKSEPSPKADPLDAEPAAEEEREEEVADSTRKNPLPWQTTVRIKIDNPYAHAVEFGSGTIIHSTTDETIILTCAHIFRINGTKKPISPAKFPLKIEVHLSDGQLRRGSQAQVHMVERHEGEALDYDFAGDVGLIRIRPGRRLPATPVVPADWVAKVKTPMTTVGCSSGNDATAWSTWITNPLIKGVDGYPNYEAIECAYPPKQGRSGGGLYTLEGQLAGVCDFNEPTGGHGLYATPRTIHKFLDRNNLTVCYAPESGRSRSGSGTLVASGRTPARAGRSNMADTFRAQNSELEPRPKRLTIPSPDDLNIEPIASADESRELSRPGDPGRRKPSWSSGGAEGHEIPSRTEPDGPRVRVASGPDPRGRDLRRDGQARPQPAEISMPSNVDPDPFEGIDPPRSANRPKASTPAPAPAAKPRSGQVWKPAKPESRSESSDR